MATSAAQSRVASPSHSMATLADGSKPGAAAAGATATLTALQTAKIARDALMAKALRDTRQGNEHRLMLQARVKDFGAEQANIREANMMEARNLFDTQLVQRRLTDGWQKDLVRIYFCSSDWRKRVKWKLTGASNVM